MQSSWQFGLEGWKSNKQQERAMTDYPTVKMLIGGEWVADGSEGSMPVVNPATEQVIGNCPKASKDQLDAALAAATSRSAGTARRIRSAWGPASETARPSAAAASAE